MANTQDLFPLPSSLHLKLSPAFWPGSTYESTKALLESLKENHEKYHVYFDPRGFHDHISHCLLALWGLGAPADIMTAAYKHHNAYQAPAFESEEAITKDNWTDHLGDHKYYTGYRKFFTEVVQKKGVAAALEEYIFDKIVNFEGASNKHPQMLNRLVDGLVHPMIHIGYGVEFGLPGITVEGLASMSVHQAKAKDLLPPSMWSSLGSSKTSPKNIHALTILFRVLKDAQFGDARPFPEGGPNINETVEKHGAALFKYASEWTFNASDSKEVERKIEELVWMNVIIYGIGGWTKGKPYNADFYTAHLVTSAVFLPSIVAILKPASQELFLRAYFAFSLAWWITRGRPEFDIPGFFTEDNAQPIPAGSFPTPHPDSLPSQTSPIATTPNSWFPIIQSALVIPDDHLPKLHRALAHFGSVYGTRAPGQQDFADTELPFADKLDGSLFIRAAGLTNERLRKKDVEVTMVRFWDHHGFYKN